MNKTSSTVWLRHRPAGVDVRCAPERSQSVNGLRAWIELAGKPQARRQDSATLVRGARGLVRRQKRRKSRGQKARMIEGKKHWAKSKSQRGQVGAD